MTAGALVNANGSVWRGTRNSNATLPTRSRVTGREVDEYGRELTVTGADRAAVVRCVRTYGEARRFLEAFNPSLQGRTMESEERTFAGRAPELCVVRAAYGLPTARAWLSIQLNDLSEFSGVKDKLTPEQIGQLADVILGQYWYLKVSEVMYFLQLFKGGRFGRFYGAVDAMAITEAMQQFLKERFRVLERLETARRAAALRREREERAGECLTRAEWEELSWLWNMGYEPERLRREREEA